MQTTLAVALFALGLYFIIKGGDLFVDAACWIAKKSGVPAFVIGATIVAVATTLPEMLVSVFAALKARTLMNLGDYIGAAGRVDITIGNAIGSATANTGLILALSISLLPHSMDGQALRVKALLLISASVTLCAFGLSGEIGILPCLLLCLLFIAFIAENLIAARHAPPACEANESQAQTRRIHIIEDAIAFVTRGRETPENIVKFALGAAGIAAGAQMLVDNGTALARALSVPEGIIGVTMIAIGTSLPELITTLTAIRKGMSALSIGNIIGANIIDITIILPVSTLLSGVSLQVSRQGYMLDLPACALLSLIAVLPPMLKGLKTGEYKFTRAQGGILAFVYAAYIALVLIGV